MCPSLLFTLEMFSTTRRSGFTNGRDCYFGFKGLLLYNLNDERAGYWRHCLDNRTWIIGRLAAALDAAKVGYADPDKPAARPFGRFSSPKATARAGCSVNNTQVTPRTPDALC